MMVLLIFLAVIFAAFGYAACVVAGREDEREERRWRENNGHFDKRYEDA